MNRKQTKDDHSLFEWMDHLGPEVAGKAPIVYAVGGGQRLLRQVERPEDKVEHREGRREVLLATLIGRGVMPAMKDRASDHVAQWPERPVEIGVDERRMRDREWPEDHQRIGRYSGQQQDDVGGDA